MGPQRGTETSRKLGRVQLIPVVGVIIGYVAAVAGVAMLSIPVAFILGGLALTVFSLSWDVDRG
jgi:hypothetical protein